MMVILGMSLKILVTVGFGAHVYFSDIRFWEAHSE